MGERGAGVVEDDALYKGRKMRKISVLMAVCLVLALALNVMAQRTHPNIMNDLDATRDALDASREAGELDVVATRAEGIQRLLGEVVPIYERMNLQAAATQANEAAQAWSGVVAAATANNLDGLATAYDAARGTCGAASGYPIDLSARQPRLSVCPGSCNAPRVRARADEARG